MTIEALATPTLVAHIAHTDPTVTNLTIVKRVAARPVVTLHVVANPINAALTPVVLIIQPIHLVMKIDVTGERVRTAETGKNVLTEETARSAKKNSTIESEKNVKKLKITEKMIVASTAGATTIRRMPNRNQFGEIAIIREIKSTSAAAKRSVKRIEAAP